MGKLEQSDAEAAAVQKAGHPRVTLDHLKGLVAHTEWWHPTAAPHVTICALTTVTGFTVFGESAPADPDNFDRDLGCKFSYEQALGKLWPLEGYLLCHTLFHGA